MRKLEVRVLKAAPAYDSPAEAIQAGIVSAQNSSAQAITTQVQGREIVSFDRCPFTVHLYLSGGIVLRLSIEHVGVTCVAHKHYESPSRILRPMESEVALSFEGTEVTWPADNLLSSLLHQKLSRITWNRHALFVTCENGIIIRFSVLVDCTTGEKILFWWEDD